MSQGVLARLRDFVPIRPLTREEALRVAERQAQRFLQLVGITEPPIPAQAIADLPRIQVERLSPMPVSGATHWSDGRWMVVLNAAEPVCRQRFSLSHEFKHILDHRFIDVLYHGVPRPQRDAWIEQVCDFFAASLLMPRPWVKRLYGNGVQAVAELAARFEVSRVAMQYRLQQIGLADPPLRCSRSVAGWSCRPAPSDEVLYCRTPSVVLA